MPVDVELDDATAAPDPESRRLGPIALFKDVLLHPSAAMRRLDAYPGRRWWLPLTVLAVLTVLNAVMMAPRQAAATMQALQSGSLPPGVSAQAMSAMPPPGTLSALTMVTGAIGALFSVVVGALFVAALLHFLGTVFGGQQTFNTVLTTTSWARVPLIFRGLIQLVWFGLHPGAIEPNMAGLSGLVANVETSSQAATSFAAPLLGRIEIWNLWFVVLLVIAVRATSKVTRGRAILIVGVYVLFGIGAGLVGTALGRAMAGITGG